MADTSTTATADAAIATRGPDSGEPREAPTYRIDAAQLAATRDKIERINRRADARGLGGRLELEWEEVTVSETDPLSAIPTARTMYDVTLGGIPPHYAGWQFIASLDWDEHAGLIVRGVPGAAQVERQRLREGWCDHCRIDRDRRVIYVVREAATGRQMQVGRSCVKDFLGWPGAVSFLDAPRPEDPEEWFGPSGEHHYSPLTVLAYAWAVIKLYGWVPKYLAGYGTTATAELVERALYPSRTSQRDKEFARTLAPVAGEATAKAKEILEFVRSPEFSGDGDYVINLKAVAAGRSVSPRNLGLLVSAPQAYARHQEQTLLREAKQGESSAWFGEVKQRYELTLTVVGIRWLEGYWGTTTLYKLLDEDGNLFVWFASSDALGEDEGARFVIKGTVKEHSEYRGARQTVLTRCKALEGPLISETETVDIIP